MKKYSLQFFLLPHFVFNGRGLSTVNEYLVWISAGRFTPRAEGTTSKIRSLSRFLLKLFFERRMEPSITGSPLIFVKKVLKHRNKKITFWGYPLYTRPIAVKLRTWRQSCHLTVLQRLLRHWISVNRKGVPPWALSQIVSHPAICGHCFLSSRFFPLFPKSMSVPRLSL